ncbi:MAG: T9SS type A sorting domain-containing protein, partial [Pedobacter sp.]
GITGATPSLGATIAQTLTNPSSTTPGSVEYIVTPTASGCAGNPYSIIVTVNAATNALAGTTGGASVCNSQDVGTSSNFLNNCEFIATVTPSGGTPVTGIVNACVKVDAAVSTSPLYVQRTFTVTATAATTATVTLYFLQSEFNAFNSANGTFGDLPTGSSDAAGKANLRISVFPSAAHTPGGAGEILYDPNDADIVFNSAASRWEVTLPVTLAANNSFFVHTNHWPLPVSLIDFKGEQSGSSNRLIWSTATENNNRGFNIERSADGKNFSSIGFVASKADNGNSTAVLNYELTDQKPFAGNSYYRLKQIDRDGKVAYSKLVLLGRKVAELSLSSVYPNPSVNEMTVVINSPKQEKITLVVTELSGKIVMERSMVIATGANQPVINVGRLSAGTYIIRAICTTYKLVTTCRNISL